MPGGGGPAGQTSASLPSTAALSLPMGHHAPGSSVPLSKASAALSLLAASVSRGERPRCSRLTRGGHTARLCTPLGTGLSSPDVLGDGGRRALACRLHGAVEGRAAAASCA